MSLLRLASAAALRSPLRAAPAAVRSSCVRVVAPAVASSFVSAASFHWSAARPAAAASAASSSPVNPIKYTTNLAGIDVVPNAREVLMGLLQETIAAIAAYNKQHGFEPLFNARVRKQSQHRLTICEEEESHAAIEKRIWYGQIEQLIEQAEDELDLVVVMNEELKPWVEDPQFLAERAAVETPNFGETLEEMKAKTPKPWSEAEQAKVDAFWKSIDEEIAADQKREAEERANKK